MDLVDYIVVPCSLVGILFALLQFQLIKKVSVEEVSLASQDALNPNATCEFKAAVCYARIMEGAKTFIREEYTIAAIFCAAFGALICGLVTWGSGSFVQGGATAAAFWVGAATSMLCGYLGMMIATFSNVRTTLSARDDENGCKAAFNIAFRGGGVMGYLLCSLGVLILWIMLTLYKNVVFSDDVKDLETLMDCVAGYGLGGSTVAMFGRVGGGIYTKAADVGADLVGKVVAGLEEDDPRNPATIADNVGDNVGDIAGMGSDLFGSFAESTCASLVIAASVVSKNGAADSLGEAGWNALLFPVAISATGIIVCMLCSFVATDCCPVKVVDGIANIETVLKVQMSLTAFLMLPVTYFLAHKMLPAEFVLESVRIAEGVVATPTKAFVCIAFGTIGGLIIGLITEYYTSHTYQPVRDLATACKSGAAVNVIFGMALGYKSCIIPVFVLSANIYVAFSLCDLYGIALAALGMLSTLATGLTIDGFGPISDNAGGIAEMAEFEPMIRDRTDALDSAGNTTAAIGKGFAIGSAALVSLALYGAFVVRLKGLLVNSPVDLSGVNIMEPTTFAALLIGAMIPYWFAALTMRSVGEAAGEMVEEVKRQFSIKDANGKTILEGGKVDPDYDACITISTKSSLKEMVGPGALVIGSPLIMGTLFGVQAVFGLLTGSLVSSVQLAISMSNSGGAWDNTKKFIKGSFSTDPELQFDKKAKDVGSSRAKVASAAHDAAVQGDTVGDPFKDTSGPALNIVMKLQAIVSLVFAAYFAACNEGQGFLRQ